MSVLLMAAVAVGHAQPAPRAQRVEPPVLVLPADEELAADSRPVFSWKPPYVEGARNWRFLRGSDKYHLLLLKLGSAGSWDPAGIDVKLPSGSTRWQCDQALGPGEYMWTVGVVGTVHITENNITREYVFSVISGPGHFTVRERGAEKERKDEGAGTEQPQTLAKVVRGFYRYQKSVREDGTTEIRIDQLDPKVKLEGLDPSGGDGFFVPLKLKDVRGEQRIAVTIDHQAVGLLGPWTYVEVLGELYAGSRPVPDQTVELALRQGDPAHGLGAGTNTIRIHKSAGLGGPEHDYGDPLRVDVHVKALGGERSGAAPRCRLKLMLVIANGAGAPAGVRDQANQRVKAGALPYISVRSSGR